MNNLSIVQAFLFIVSGSIVVLIVQALVRELHKESPPSNKDYNEATKKTITNWLVAGVNKGFVKDNQLVDKDGLTNWLESNPYIKSETINPKTRAYLQCCFHLVLFAHFLYAIIFVTMIYGISDGQIFSISHAAIAAMFGSTIAAFRSALDRRAQGFEDKYGNQCPLKKESVGRFSDQMVYWLACRPILGGLVGMIFFFALDGNVLSSTLTLEDDIMKLLFYAILVGLFAKTVLDALLSIAKSIFKLK